MNWTALTEEKQLDVIIEQSKSQPVVILKHSTRCNISGMVKNRLDGVAAPDGSIFYLLDLLTYRPISNKIALMFGVAHESPQVLVIKDGKCVYDESHHAITMPEIEAHL